MPGRQSHGRPLLSSKAAPKNFRKSKSKAQAKALDAFTIASEQYPTKEKRTPRFREIEAAPDTGKKHSRANDNEDEDEDEDDDEEQPRRKKVKPSAGGAGGNDSDEYGSDSEGNEWHYGVNDDEDSELDSDEAFGESDQEDFQGYSFRGSKTAKGNQDDSEEEEDDDESLGEDAIDLAQALDEYESDESMADQDEEDSEGSDDSDSEAESPPSSDDDDDEEQEADPSKLGELQKFIAGFGGEDDKDTAPTKQKQKINLKDLGLAGVKDAQMRKSVKLMAKEEKETSRPGAGKKLEVPLSRRQQDKLQRAAAYEKANETLTRWQETVKHNRRAEHLVFPLPQNAADAGLDNRELQAITAKNSASELEQTILGIMEQSGLAMNKQEENKMKKAEAEEGLSQEALKDLVNQRRRERELNSREAKRAKRIKKIKSKAYHRVHRKEKEREEMKLHEAMAENGEIDSEAERDAQDRARALERVGARHRDSKWAKLGAGNKRAVWDDDYRAGLHDMARREEELRKRKEGRAGGDEDSDRSADDGSDSDGSDEEGGEQRKLLKQLSRLEQEEDDGPASKLMQMKFMQKAEAAQKKANDELIAQIRRDLDSDAGEGNSDAEVTEVGRKKFGSAAQPVISAPALSARKQKKTKAAQADDNDDDVPDNSVVNTGYSLTAEPSTAGSAWSSGPRKKSAKTGGKSSGARVEDLDNTLAMTAASGKPKSSKSSKSKSSAVATTGGTTLADEEESDGDSDSPDVHLPLAIRDIAAMDKAFAGDDVVVDFAREKADVEAEDDDKIVDNTLPGWGGWVGDGVSNREKKRQQGRFVTKVEGVKKADRKDAKLDKVIISEKRVKKNDKYLASQLPHPFESKAQYERSLRLPLGPEWVTKESHQEATKPRILKKQGIIAPMSRPTM
ncbi:small nucleolar ribonucleoprotein complex subunit utp14 [Colletotrichum incanum]|uniref:Small nucleolar ribonucleoprotein complex subunit utp14 n=1 Tax=Colletotrichum incanum TaxID=1573173 RepID=A0A161W3Z6_COLIC|nr:small nucleolar ribonucleoprotein complex subunit utp14 [Colletotrichum incanum]